MQGQQTLLHESDRPHWEHFNKQTHMGIRGIGATPEKAFEQAARALTAFITDLECVEPKETITISCQAPDRGLLLVDWLNAVVYKMLVNHMVFCEFEIQLSGHCLNAVVRGERLDRSKHHPAVRVKGVNYKDLSVTKDPAGYWVSQCGIDIEACKTGSSTFDLYLD